MDPIQVTTFYRFFPIASENLQKLQEQIQSEGEKREIRGLLLLATEGVNSTISGPREHIEAFKGWLLNTLEISELPFKDSFCEKHPFHEFKVKIRTEIVTADRPDLRPDSPRHNHLSPEEWDQALNEPDSLVIDTRNDYEYRVGHFKKAINPKISEFTEFTGYMKKAEVPKDKKVLIYCTGGIRCEKAILQLEEMGYSNVYQLEGGILNYLEKKPHQSFEGECFVFDYRVAVDQTLKPTEQYQLCPHCGDPARERIECIQCGRPEIVCKDCLEKEKQFETCSKNCAHHYRMGHKSRRIHKDSHKKRCLT